MITDVRIDRAISIRQPVAYLAGCVLGDAWIGTSGLCLRVADEDFAETFAQAIFQAFAVEAKVRVDERGYFLVRKMSAKSNFASLLSYQPQTVAEKCSWLRGMFDSEGNASLYPKPKSGPRSWDRRVAFYSTNEITIGRTAEYLTELNLETRTSLVTPSRGHKGRRPVLELLLRPGREQYERFASLVGSSIQRKASTLRLLPASYCDDLDQVCREMQARRVAIGRARRDAGGKY